MLTYKMGGSPNKSVAEPAVGNSHSSLRGKLYREPRVMHIHGTVTINSDNSTHPYRVLTWSRHCPKCFPNIQTHFRDA